MRNNLKARVYYWKNRRVCELAHVPAIMHVCQTINTECIYVLCAFTYFLYTADLNAFPLQDDRCAAETRKTDKALWRRKKKMKTIISPSQSNYSWQSQLRSTEEKVIWVFHIPARISSVTYAIIRYFYHDRNSSIKLSVGCVRESWTVELCIGVHNATASSIYL